MTRTVRISLGSSPLAGKQAIDQAGRFKDQLRSLSKKPETVTLLTVVSVEEPHMSVVAMYDAEDEGAVEWVRQAEERAPELWAKLNERRRGAVR
jgi:hypothetical protein